MFTLYPWARPLLAGVAVPAYVEPVLVLDAELDELDASLTSSYFSDVHAGLACRFAYANATFSRSFELSRDAVLSARAGYGGCDSNPLAAV
jgi:hypothetical protein